MRTESPKLPAKRGPNPNQLAISRRRAQRFLELGAGLASGVVLAVWLTLSFILGSLYGAGPLVHAIWLAIFTVAAVTSPVAMILLRSINNKFKAGRLALSEGDGDGETPPHLVGDLARFYADTRVARIGISDAVEPGEGVRILWDWRRRLEKMGDRERQELEQVGVGPGPIPAMLDDLQPTGDAALDEGQLREASTHLGHIEGLLATEHKGIYR